MGKRTHFSGTVKTIICLVLLALALAAIAIRSRAHRFPELSYSDGRIFQVEAVTFGTSHVPGINDWWTVPLRKVLPDSLTRRLTPARGRSCFTTPSPALVVWVFARSAATGKYVDCQGMTAFFTDEHGDVFPAKSNSADGFNRRFDRQGFIFEVFPRHPKRLKFHLSPSLSDPGRAVWVQNPVPSSKEENWRPESIPAVHVVEGLQFSLKSLTIETNGGFDAPWQPYSLHWKPVVKIAWTALLTDEWEPIAWEAMDPTGNRGQTLGLHEPVLKFSLTSRPKPEMVKTPSLRWQFPMMNLPSTTDELHGNTNRVLHHSGVLLYGLFPPGIYGFSQGALSEARLVAAGDTSDSGWISPSEEFRRNLLSHLDWYGNPANYVVFLRLDAKQAEERIAVCLRDEQGHAVWSQEDHRKDIRAFTFNLPAETHRVAMEIVLLEPVQTEFTVKPPAY